MNEMVRHLLRGLKILCGFVLLAVGVIGGFLPVVQGWVFVLAGLAILATEFTWAKRLQTWLKARVRAAVQKVRQPHAEKRTDELGQTNLSESDR